MKITPIPTDRDASTSSAADGSVTTPSGQAGAAEAIRTGCMQRYGSLKDRGRKPRRQSPP